MAKASKTDAKDQFAYSVAIARDIIETATYLLIPGLVVVSVSVTIGVVTATESKSAFAIYFIIIMGIIAATWLL